MTEGAVAQAARRLLQNVQTQYFASYQMARQVGVGRRPRGRGGRRRRLADVQEVGRDRRGGLRGLG